MKSVTLDTSAALNFLNTTGEEPDEDLLGVIRAGLDHHLDLRITDEAWAEVEDTRDPAVRAQRLARLGVFPRLEVENDVVGERDRVATDLLRALFPNSPAGSNSHQHHLRDCKQLAAHLLLNRRGVFLTRDEKLFKKRARVAPFGITVVNPAILLSEIAAALLQPDEPSVIRLRAAKLPADAAAIRSVLAPLAADYPEFDAWVEGLFDARKRRRITVGEFEGAVAAVAVTVPKAGKVAKLGAFYVADVAQRAALGQHLMWSEIRAWARAGYRKVYVTVASRHAQGERNLLGFFAGFGFRIEGVSLRRYDDTAAEFVLGKHLVHERIDESEMDRFAAEHAPSLLGLPDAFETESGWWALPPRELHPKFRWDGSGATTTLVAHNGEEPSRLWSLADLERQLYPARFALTDRKALVVPIHPQFAEAMFDYIGHQLRINEPDEDRLLLRTDNVYYGYPKHREIAQSGAPILFYVTNPISAIVGEARLIESDVGAADYLFVRYGGLGVWQAQDLRDHARNKDGSERDDMALRFGLYVPFSKPVEHRTIRRDVLATFNPQGLTTVDYEVYERIRDMGGLAP